MIDRLRSWPAEVPLWVRRVLVLVGLVAMAAVILVTPVSDWWSQRNEIQEAEDQLALLRADNQELSERLDRIADPATVERIARRELGLVREGEESYTILPPSTAGLLLPDTWPFDRIAASMIEPPG